MQTRILFYVQHLLGIGHLMRASRIATALSEAFEVLLVVGGDLPPGIEPEGVNLFQLPPVRAGSGGFGTLTHPDGTIFDTQDKAARRDLLLGCFDEYLPDIVLIEAFPFGRRQMRFELIPLLDRAAAAVHRPLIACSVRDILQEVRPERAAETLDLIQRYFGLVIVHGDPRLVTLGDSFPDAKRIESLIQYTGMVGPEREGPLMPYVAPDEVFDVVVSVGGGAVGTRLVEAALLARPLTKMADARWLVLTGPNSGALRCPAPPDGGVSIRPFVSDLPARLARARVSVSQAGYNTVADLVAARCRAVLVPFASGGETEQVRRAALFQGRGWAVTLDERELDPASLAAAIERALALPDAVADVALEGAALTRMVLERHLGLG